MHMMQETTSRVLAPKYSFLIDLCHLAQITFLRFVWLAKRK